MSYNIAQRDVAILKGKPGLTLRHGLLAGWLFTTGRTLMPCKGGNDYLGQF